MPKFILIFSSLRGLKPQLCPNLEILWAPAPTSFTVARRLTDKTFSWQTIGRYGYDVRATCFERLVVTSFGRQILACIYTVVQTLNRLNFLNNSMKNEPIFTARRYASEVYAMDLVSMWPPHAVISQYPLSVSLYSDLEMQLAITGYETPHEY